MATIIGFFLASMTITVIVILPLSYVAKKVGLIDKPSSRKRHTGNVPLTGGTALLIITLTFILATDHDSKAISSIMLLAPLVWLLGILDDRFDLPAQGRLIAQTGFGVLLTYTGTTLLSLDGITGTNPIVLSEIVGAIITTVFVCGGLNACNMSDGVDGLLGLMSTMTLLVLAYFAWSSETHPESIIALVTAGGICGYLLFNLGLFGISQRVFLGDSGSMLIGMCIVILLISQSQGKSASISPTSAGWLLGLPLLDTVTVTVRRIYQKRSPFTAGRDHLHHVLLDLGLGRWLTLMTLCAIHLAMLTVGVLANLFDIPQAIFFWLFLVATLAELVLVEIVVRKLTGGTLSTNGIESGDNKSAMSDAIARRQNKYKKAKPINTEHQRKKEPTTGLFSSGSKKHEQVETANASLRKREITPQRELTP